MFVCWSESINLFSRRCPFICHKNRNSQMRSQFPFFYGWYSLLSRLVESHERKQIRAFLLLRRTNRTCAQRIHVEYSWSWYRRRTYYFLVIEINPIRSVNACKCQVQSGNASHNDFIWYRTVSTMTERSTHVHTDEKMMEKKSHPESHKDTE